MKDYIFRICGREQVFTAKTLTEAQNRAKACVRRWHVTATYLRAEVSKSEGYALPSSTKDYTHKRLGGAKAW